MATEKSPPQRPPIQERQPATESYPAQDSSDLIKSIPGTGGQSQHSEQGGSGTISNRVPVTPPEPPPKKG